MPKLPEIRISLQYLKDIANQYIKHRGDEVDFLPSHEQKSFLQVDSISLGLHLKENMEDELDLLPTDKYQRFSQIAIIILGVCCQACPNYPK